MTETALSGSSASSAGTPPRSFLRDPSVLLLAVTVVAAAALMPVEPGRAFGLPAHALLLHIPVVLIPILAATVVLLAVRPVWRRRYGLATGVFALVTMAATILTAGAGEALRDERAARIRARAAQAGGAAGAPRRAPGGGGEGGRLEHHADLGQQLRLILILLAVVFIVLVIIDRYGARAASGLAAGSALGTAVAAVAAVIAVVAAIWVVRTGHVGAEMTWHEGAAGVAGHLLRHGTT